MTTYLLPLLKPAPLATFVNQSHNGAGWTTSVERNQRSATRGYSPVNTLPLW